MTRTDHTEIACSIARSADVIGDEWTPLILRDVHLGIDTFNELVRDLGISRALLIARLRTLVAGGILHEQPYQERPVRRRYLLPEAGSELIPVLVALMRWGDRWRSPDGAPLVFTHDCGAQLETAVVCIACGDAAHPGTLHPAAGPGGRSGPGTRVIAERLALVPESAPQPEETP